MSFSSLNKDGGVPYGVRPPAIDSLSRGRTAQAGFTLLEVLVVIAVLVFISLGIYQSTVQAFRIRDSLQSSGEFYNSIRIAMGVVDRDISQLYSPLLMIQNGYSPPAPGVSAAPSAAPSGAPLNSNTQGELQKGGVYWSAALDNSGLRPSHFVGEAKKFTFISSSHVRMYKDLPESELVKIAFEFKNDEKPEPGVKADNASVLVKTENVDVFEDDDFKDQKNGFVYPLLHGITKYKIEYYDKRKEKWQNDWDSEKDNNQYPDAIRMSFEAHGVGNLSFEGTYYFRPEVPVNGYNPSS